MNYHNITIADMLNGDGLRTVLWVAGCSHHCKQCQNPQTWDVNGGIPFDSIALDELLKDLSSDWCNGLTLSGGDPLHVKNRDTILALCERVKRVFPQKTIWCYTGYSWEDVYNLPVMRYIDVLVDGEFDVSKKDVRYPWAGSTNQKVINVKKSLATGEVVLYASH